MPRNATAFQSGAADGSRTHLCSLGSCRSTDELQPHLSCYYTRPLHILQPPNLLRHERLFADIDSTIEAKGDHHEKTRRAAVRPAGAGEQCPGAGSIRALGSADGKGDGHRPLRQGRTCQAGARQRHQGHDAAADHGGHRRRTAPL